MAKRLIIEKGISIFRKHQAITALVVVQLCKFSAVTPEFLTHPFVSPHLHIKGLTSSSLYGWVQALSWEKTAILPGPLSIYIRKHHTTHGNINDTRVCDLFICRQAGPTDPPWLICICWWSQVLGPLNYVPHVFKWGDIKCKHSIIPPVNLFLL